MTLLWCDIFIPVFKDKNYIYFLGFSSTMSLVESPSSSSLNNHDFFQRDTTSQSPESSSNSGGKISPAILFIIIILAVIFFISGLLHLLVRFFIRKRSSSSSSFSQSNRYPDNISTSEGIQRQLQNLFHLHDSGLDQAFIDALPVFQYKEIVGLKEPFDCAVCLCEFSEQDKLRLLPLCSHAFHIDCIDTWLLSNSTCPLCRGALYTPGLAIENPVFDFDESREDDTGGGGDCNGHHKGVEIEIVSEKSKRVFPVRLGKFKSTSNSNINNSEVVHEQVLQRDVGETSSSNLDARRCFSMGSYQYVVADSVMQVALCPNRPSNGGAESKIIKGRGGQNGNFTCNIRDDDDDVEARKINNIGTKNESLSVSKIWLWSKKGKFPNSTNATDFSSGFPVDMNLPWTNRGQAT